jgi:hypothetical protein
MVLLLLVLPVPPQLPPTHDAGAGAGAIPGVLMEDSTLTGEDSTPKGLSEVLLKSRFEPGVSTPLVPVPVLEFNVTLFRLSSRHPHLLNLEEEDEEHGEISPLALWIETLAA